MASLEDFFKARQAIASAMDCINLPAADPVYVSINYDKLLGDHKSGPPYFRRFDQLFNWDFTSKIDELSPLGDAILPALDVAGIELPALSFDLRIEQLMVLPRKWNYWHTDGGVSFDYDEGNTIRNSKTIKLVLSDRFSTLTSPIDTPDDELPQWTDRLRLFTYKTLAATGIPVHKNKRNLLSSMGGDFLDIDKRDEIIAQMRRGVIRERNMHLPAADSAMVVFDDATPHALSCTFFDRDLEREAVKRGVTNLPLIPRTRIMLSFVLN